MVMRSRSPDFVWRAASVSSAMVLRSLKPGILFPDAPRAVVAAFLKRQAVAAAECPGCFHFLEVAVLAESPAVDACPSPDVHGQLSHSLLDYSVPVRIMYLELNMPGPGKNHGHLLLRDGFGTVHIFAHIQVILCVFFYRKISRNNATFFTSNCLLYMAPQWLSWQSG